MGSIAQQVGSPDPRKRTSPICELEEGGEPDLAGLEPGESTCFFNGESFPQGTEVESGGNVLRCERGSWISAPRPERQQ
jgi:hypothetical protein